MKAGTFITTYSAVRGHYNNIQIHDLYNGRNRRSVLAAANTSYGIPAYAFHKQLRSDILSLF